MKAPESKLSTRQTRALSALLTHRSFSEAAAVAKVGEVTIWRWLQQEDFKKAFEAARREVVSQALAHLQATTGKAVQALEDILEDREASASAKVSAAKVVLETSVRLIQLDDLERRLVALEETLKNGKQQYH